MKMRVAIVVGLALLLASASRAAIEFAGYMKIAGETPRFVLVDTVDRKASGWIVIGQVFKEYTIVAFDQKRETVSLRKGEATFHLPLKGSRTTEDFAEWRKAIDTSLRSIRDIPDSTSRSLH
jgi:hypothetical protein